MITPLAAHFDFDDIMESLLILRPPARLINGNDRAVFHLTREILRGGTGWASPQAVPRYSMLPAILLQLLIVLLIAGVLLWAVQQFPLDPVIARIIRVKTIVFIPLWCWQIQLLSPKFDNMDIVFTIRIEANVNLSTSQAQLDRIEQAVNHILSKEDQLMSKVTDFAAKEQLDIDALNTKLDSLATGVTALEAAITTLQNTVTGLTPEEQAALDNVTAQSDALVAKASAIDTTVPTPPTA